MFLINIDVKERGFAKSTNILKYKCFRERRTCLGRVKGLFNRVGKNYNF